MPYATVDDLRGRLGPIFDSIYDSDSDAGGDIADAQAEIDGCLAKRYEVPVIAAQPLPLLKGWTLTLAEERSYSRAAGSELAEKIKSRVALVRQYLKDAASGAFSLQGAAENVSESDAVSFVTGDPPEFTREKLKGY